jgi:hypothetical protein
MITMTLAELHDLLRKQGVERREDYAVKCPICGTVQSAASMIAAGAGETFAEVEPFLGYSCIGRFTGRPGHRRGEPPGLGCNWTLGGLLRLHELEIVTPDGERHMRFMPASPAEAITLRDSLKKEAA